MFYLPSGFSLGGGLYGGSIFRIFGVVSILRCVGNFFWVISDAYPTFSIDGPRGYRAIGYFDFRNGNFVTTYNFIRFTAATSVGVNFGTMGRVEYFGCGVGALFRFTLV